MMKLFSPKNKKKKRLSLDPPTVFEYLQQLDRKELQKQAKQHGIKANQKNDILREKLQEVMAIQKSHQEIKENIDSPQIHATEEGNEANKTMTTETVEYQEIKETDYTERTPVARHNPVAQGEEEEETIAAGTAKQTESNQEDEEERIVIIENSVESHKDTTPPDREVENESNNVNIIVDHIISEANQEEENDTEDWRMSTENVIGVNHTAVSSPKEIHGLVMTSGVREAENGITSTHANISETQEIQEASKTKSIFNIMDDYDDDVVFDDDDVAFVGDIWECDNSDKHKEVTTIDSSLLRIETDGEVPSTQGKENLLNNIASIDEAQDIPVQQEEGKEESSCGTVRGETEQRPKSKEVEITTTTETNQVDENHPPSPQKQQQQQQHSPEDKKIQKSRKVPAWKIASRDFRRARNQTNGSHGKEEEMTLTTETTKDDENHPPSPQKQQQQQHSQEDKKIQQPRKAPAWKIASRDFRRARNQTNGSHVNLSASETKKTVLSTALRNNKPRAITKNPAGRVFGERNMNDRRHSIANTKNSKTSHPSEWNGENTKRRRSAVTTIRKDVSKVIKIKNSPRSNAASNPVETCSQPRLITKTCPRPKAMPMSKRNEEQLQKFLQRQSQGRKERQKQLKNEEYVHLVRSLI